MELSVLRELWKAKNPNGNIWILYPDGGMEDSGKQTGKFGITYTQDGKVYAYKAPSVYKLAERFNLIPESNIDIWEESRKAIQALLNNQEFSSLGGLSDTIRHLAENEFSCYIDFSIEESKDKYDRRVYTFKMIKKYDSYTEYAKIKGW